MNLWDDFMLHDKNPCLKFHAPPILHKVVKDQVHKTGPNTLLLQTTVDRAVL